MAIQRTFSIIKPDATKRNLTGQIAAKFEEAGLRIVASKRIQLTLAQAQTFYGVHKERPFFDELCEFMISEPIVVQVLEGENAIAKNRESVLGGPFCWAIQALRGGCGRCGYWRATQSRTGRLRLAPFRSRSPRRR